MRHFLLALLAASTLLASLAAHAQSLGFSFVGREPRIRHGAKITVAPGIEPGVKVIFDSSISREQVTIRAATADEHSNDERAVYRMGEQQGTTYVFYELASPERIAELERQNASNTASPDGKNFENQVIDIFFANGNPLQDCVPNKPSSRGVITVYVKLAEAKPPEFLVLPEGSIAQCLINAPRSVLYPAPAASFVAKGEVRITQ
jgi:hypothetical protein